MLRMDGDALVYSETPLPIWLRVFAVVLGIGVATVIPTPFVIHTDWTTPSPVFLLIAFCIIAPFALGCFFVFVGFVSASELRLDPVAGVGERRLLGPIVNRRERFPLAQVAPPDVFMRESSEDGSYPILTLGLPRGKLEMACFKDQAEAQFWADRISLILAGRRPRVSGSDGEA